MFAKLVKAVLITLGASLALPIALKVQSFFVIVIISGGLLASFVGAACRAIWLGRIGALRAGAAPWDRESFGFACGIMIATPIAVLVLAAALAVRPPDDRIITAGPRLCLENALEGYYSDVGSYPTSPQGLSALVVSPGSIRWRGPYLIPVCRQYIGWFDYSVGSGGKPTLIIRQRDRRKPRP